MPNRAIRALPDREARHVVALVIASVLATTAFTFAWSVDSAAAAPANDHWASATDISGLAAPPYDPSLPGVSVSGTTVDATREAGEPDIGGAAALGTVWFRYTAPPNSRVGQMGYRVTDRSAFVVTAYSTYVQIAVPIPYPGDGIPSLRGMQRIGGTGYDQYGTLPGESMGGFLPAVRVDPGETVWFQVSANPAATPPVDAAFTLELFSLNDLQESIGRSGADLSACPDPTSCYTQIWGDTSAASPAPIGAATMWTKVKVAPGAPVSIVVTSVNSGWRASTRPVDVMVYEQPAGVPDYYPISDVSAFGPPIATISGAVELVDGADYGIPGVNVNQWVARVDWSASVAQYHIRVDGDPTFVQIAVSSQGSAGPTAAISDPLDGAVYSLPTDVPPLAYTCTPGSVPISTEAVTVDGTSVSATVPLPTSVGTHTIRVVCEDANGALDEANATYTVTEQLVAPAQTLVVDEDSSVTANLLTAVTVPTGETATLTAVGAASHGTVGVVGDDVTYTPAPDYTGPDQFTYTVTSSSGGTRSATVTVSVTPINDPPVAVDDTLTVNTGQSVEIDFGALVGNDADIDGGPLSVTAISIVTPSIGGQLASCGSSRPACRLYVAPTAGGVESIDYVVSDGAGGMDTGRLRITVLANALPDTLLVRLTCPGWSYTIGGPTTGLTAAPGPFGLTLLAGRARLGTADVRIAVVALRGGAARGLVQVSDPSVNFTTTLYPRNAAVAIGSTWVMTGTWWRPVGGSAVQRCTFQVNITDGG